MTEPKIKMALIATYPEMSKIFLDLADKNNVIAYDEYASFDEAVKVARKLRPVVDVILSRGATAEYIRNNVDAPVVFIPITAFDVLQAVRKVDKGVKDVALVHYESIIYGTKEIADMFGITLHEYSFRTYKDIEQIIRLIMDKGIKVLIGGDVTMQLAANTGLIGVELSAGVDTVNRAIREAKQIVKESRKAFYQAARIEAAFNEITEGIVITDESKNVIISNPNAEHLLGKKYRAGEPFSDNHSDSKFVQVADTQTPQYNYLRKIGDTTINTSNIPVMRNGELVGIVNLFEDVTQIQKLEQNIRKQLHERGLNAKYIFEDILTRNEMVETIKKRAAMYAATELAVLIEGESGTGKELFAQSIHNASKRSKGPFVAINCAAIPEQLLESELFGYESGAFTGATKGGKTGLFELAHKGTIFLDEIGEMPIQLQTRLLRVLQEKEVMRVGGTRNIPVDIRVISASNRSLLECTNAGNFRKDLYYRFNVLSITLPPLRKRKEDIELLCRYFLEENMAEISESLLAQLLPAFLAYNWPGNIRELQNIAQRLTFVFQHSQAENLPEIINILGLDQRGGIPAENSGHINIDTDVGTDIGLREAVAEFEKRMIARVIRECGGDQNLAAQQLKIGRTTLWRKGGDKGEKC